MSTIEIGFWRHSDEYKERKKKIQDDMMLNLQENNIKVLSLTDTHVIYQEKESKRTRTIERYADGQSVDEYVANGLDHLPLPIEGSSTKSIEETTKWLKKLEYIEDIAQEEFYKGYSYCRICGCKNGSTDFGIFDHNDYRFIDFINSDINPKEEELTWFIWPSGYKHYIKEHNIEVPENFWTLIEKQFFE